MTLSKIACGLDESHLIKWQEHAIHYEVETDLKALKDAADNAGFELTVASAYRGFERQAIIWNNKFQGLRPVFDLQGNQVDISTLTDIEKCRAIMLFSAIPGGSRHHFGTDLDIYASNCLASDQKLQLEPWEYQAGGPFFEFNEWLDENLSRYGFFKPYRHYNGGVAQEPWHISHLDTSSKLAKQQTVTNITLALSEHDVCGKNSLLKALPELYQQFIANICKP
jgi:LAS superfamily LD-carboxypeptidase LdcB